ncbi:MAG TPA: hypothetical protein PKW55_04160 [Spirochaetota bacterium]|nr:hypothetical protein [Spirochaetota bacterium]HOM37969.1 hypothetical protein [Spirochaetota bacterium]HPQ48774.1 hypothetical protein [Spirochaetota bacterium]
MKKNLILLLIILPIYYLYSIKLPKEPELKSPEIQDESNLKPVIIDIYGTAFKIRGNAYIKEFTLKIKTLKEGFTFYKDISLNSIKEIEILEWKGVLYDKEKASYLFYPVYYKIIDNNNISFEYKQNIKELNKIIVTTPYGKTTVFSIFFDYFNGKKWESGIEGLSLTREKPIPKVFTKIILEVKEDNNKKNE